jgi:hypothetical protein
LPGYLAIAPATVSVAPPVVVMLTVALTVALVVVAIVMVIVVATAQEATAEDV